MVLVSCSLSVPAAAARAAGGLAKLGPERVSDVTVWLPSIVYECGLQGASGWLVRRVARIQSSILSGPTVRLGLRESRPSQPGPRGVVVPHVHVSLVWLARIRVAISRCGYWAPPYGLGWSGRLRRPTLGRAGSVNLKQEKLEKNFKKNRSRICLQSIKTFMFDTLQASTAERLQPDDISHRY